MKNIACKAKETIRSMNAAELFMVVSYFIVLAIFIFRTLDMLRCVTVLHYTIYALLWITAGVIFVKRIKSKTKPDLPFILMAATAALALVSALIDKSPLSLKLTVGYWNSLLVFVSTLVIFYIYSEQTVKKSTLRIALVINLLIATATIIVFLFSPKAYYLLVNGGTKVNYSYMTLNWNNPNSTGILLVFIFLNLFMNICVFDDIKIRLGTTVYLAVIFLMITKTLSRNAQFAALAFLAMALFVVIFFRKRRIYNWLCALVILVPLIFALFYLLMSKTDFLQSVFGVFSKASKGVGSRINVWTMAIERFGSNWLFGAYYNNHTENELLSVLSTYGGPALVLCCAYFFSLILKINKKGNSVVNKVGIIAFLAYLLSGFADGYYLTTGSAGTFILCAAIIAIASFKEDAKASEENVPAEVVSVEGAAKCDSE